MPPKKRVKVEWWSRLRPDADYPLKVTDIGWGESDTCLAVVLTHLAEDQAGRTVKLDLPLPVRPEGRTASFLRAAGLDVAVGNSLDPMDAKGAVVQARFDVGADGNGDVAEFRPGKEQSV